MWGKLQLAAAFRRLSGPWIAPVFQRAVNSPANLDVLFLGGSAGCELRRLSET